MIYVIIAIILFLIETEYNYRVNLFNLEDIDKFEDKINFVIQKNPDYFFKKLNLKFRDSNSRYLFPKYKTVQIRRQLFINHCVRIFGEEKLIDLVEKKRLDLIQKYGQNINIDIEIFNILIDYFRIYEFKKIKSN